MVPRSLIYSGFNNYLIYIPHTRKNTVIEVEYVEHEEWSNYEKQSVLLVRYLSLLKSVVTIIECPIPFTFLCDVSMQTFVRLQRELLMEDNTSRDFLPPCLFSTRSPQTLLTTFITEGLSQWLTCSSATQNMNTIIHSVHYTLKLSRSVCAVKQDRRVVS